MKLEETKEERTEMIERPKTPEAVSLANELKPEESPKKVRHEDQLIKMLLKEETPDIEKMESSAAEALMALACQDNNVIRHRSPGPIQPNIIRTLQSLSSKYINDEPILKESEKIDMFSEIPTTDSEEESLEIRRLR